MKFGKKETSDSKSVVDIFEEAVHLLRMVPASTLTLYLVGSVPFVLAFLFFWSDMARSADARERCGQAAFIMAVLFVWMKLFHSLFTERLMDHLLRKTASKWNASHIFRLALCQGILQPSGIVLLPLSLIFTLPFVHTYSFYQNLSVLQVREGEGMRDLVSRANHQAGLWRMQSAVLVWMSCPLILLLAVFLSMFSALFFGASNAFLIVSLFVLVLISCPIGLVIFINIAVALFYFPLLIHMLFGIETQFHLSGASAFLNSTFLATVSMLSYLVMDPVVKAAYTLRCFYGESLVTGKDLSADFQEIIKRGAKILILIVGIGATMTFISDIAAQDSSEESVSVQELDTLIDTVLQDPMYRWRLPRETPLTDDDQQEQGFLAEFLTTIGKTIKKWISSLVDWIQEIYFWIERHWPEFLKGKSEEGDGNSAWDLTGIRGLLYAGIGLVSFILIFLLIRKVRLRRRQARNILTVAEPIVTPDLEDENVTADQLPIDEWMQLAREMLQKGEYRLALRALFLSNLAWLGGEQYIRIARFKSNRDYQMELNRRTHDMPVLFEVFSENVNLFESIWYGKHHADQIIYDKLNANLERMQNRGD